MNAHRRYTTAVERAVHHGREPATAPISQLSAAEWARQDVVEADLDRRPCLRGDQTGRDMHIALTGPAGTVTQMSALSATYMAIY